MLKDLHTLSPYLDFIHACSADPDYRDPMLLTEQQLHRNLLDAPENPNTRVLGTFENDTVTGVFALLVLEDEKYLELLAGLSRSAVAYDELLAHLKSAYPGYQADFVYNPRNRLLQAALEALDAKFDPEQQKLYKKYFPNGGGSIFTFEIKGDAKKAQDFIDQLELFSLLANVADVKSLAIHPASTTHSECNEAELLDQGIKPNTIRLSIGTENIDDIIEDLDEAFEAVQ